jgi:hypothetical protein
MIFTRSEGTKVKGMAVFRRYIAMEVWIRQNPLASLRSPSDCRRLGHRIQLNIRKARWLSAEEFSHYPEEGLGKHTALSSLTKEEKM